MGGSNVLGIGVKWWGPIVGSPLSNTRLFHPGRDGWCWDKSGSFFSPAFKSLKGANS